MSLVIGLAALIATVWVVGPGEIFEHLHRIGWMFLVLVGIETPVGALRWDRGLLHGARPRPADVARHMVAQLAGRGVNSVTPGGNLGEALKVGLLSHNCSPRRIVAAVMYVNLVALVISFAVIGIGSAATAFLFDVPDAGVVALCVGGAVGLGISCAIVVLIRRGMLTTLSNALARLRIISKKRRESWNKTLVKVDARLKGTDDGTHRRKAIACIVVSQSLQKALTYVTILSAGYSLSAGQFLALLSAGVLLGWIDDHPDGPRHQREWQRRAVHGDRRTSRARPRAGVRSPREPDRVRGAGLHRARRGPRRFARPWGHRPPVPVVTHQGATRRKGIPSVTPRFSI